MRTILILIGIGIAAWPEMTNAKPLHFITCDMVRAYVGQVGVVQAREVALAYGMTASQERQARRCLAEGS